MLETIRHLDYVILLCDDLARMRHFYHEVMRFPVYHESATWIELRVGSVLLTLRQRGRSYDGPSFQPRSAGVQLAFRVAPDQVDGCYAELSQQGVEILSPPTSHAYGHRTLFFKDPEGNILEIYADI
jgi:catechol-2,3-dioxygenase